jgi:MtN3 and saliva related transmembrane protein
LACPFRAGEGKLYQPSTGNPNFAHRADVGQNISRKISNNIVMDLLTQIIGYLAAAVGTSLMLPQVIKAIKTKKVNDVSLIMLVLYFFNCSLWLTYGILIWALPVILCNFIALIISIIQLGLKLKYHQKG